MRAMRTSHVVLGSLLLTLLPLGVAHAEEPTPPEPLRAFAAEWWAAEDVWKREGLAVRATTEKMPVDGLLEALADTRPREEVETGSTRWKQEDPNGLSHEVYGHVPEGYDAGTPTPLLVWLHGGVARDQDGGGVFGLRLFAADADEKGYLIVAPSARRGAEWWTPAGEALIRGAVAEARKRWNVDEDLVVAAGFSDGASACFHLLQHDPEPWCGFLAFMGNPVVSRLMGGPAWTSNVTARPVFAAHAGKDQLYPTASMKPFMDQLEAAGCELDWRDVPDGTHSHQAMAGIWEDAYAWWISHPRTAARPAQRWSTSMPSRNGHVDAIEILEVEGRTPAKEDTFPVPPPRPRLGITLNQQYQGPGLQIDEVSEGSNADKAGMESGDILIAVNDVELEDPRQSMQVLRTALAALASGDATETATFTLERGDQTVTVEARPGPIPSDASPRPKALGYDLPVGTAEVVWKPTAPQTFEVTTQGVKHLRLRFAAWSGFDPTKPIKVLLNGRVAHEGVVKVDLPAVLRRVANSGRVRLRYTRALDLRP